MGIYCLCFFVIECFDRQKDIVVLKILEDLKSVYSVEFGFVGIYAELVINRRIINFKLNNHISNRQTVTVIKFGNNTEYSVILQN